MYVKSLILNFEYGRSNVRSRIRLPSKGLDFIVQPPVRQIDPIAFSNPRDHNVDSQCPHRIAVELPAADEDGGQAPARPAGEQGSGPQPAQPVQRAVQGAGHFRARLPHSGVGDQGQGGQPGALLGRRGGRPRGPAAAGTRAPGGPGPDRAQTLLPHGLADPRPPAQSHGPPLCLALGGAVPRP